MMSARTLVRISVVLAVFAVGWAALIRHPAAIEQPAGLEVAPHPPVQHRRSPWTLVEGDGHTITGLATFRLEARALAVKFYNFDDEARFSPIDIAFGWGRMSDTAVLDQLEISQNNRFYYYRYRNPPPIPKREIVRSSANMHLIPANSDVEAALKQARVGAVISLEGYLVEVTREDGWRWKSSMTRADSGAGACELIYVTRAEIIDPMPS